jgi:uncharacterized membrane protein YbhN (UPF0104 family)
MEKAGVDTVLTTPRQGRARSVGKNVALVVATVALVALLVWKLGGTAPILEAARGARPGWIAVAFVASFACVLIGTLRWQVVVGAMGPANAQQASARTRERYSLPFGRALGAVLAAWPLSAVTPSRAGDLARAWTVSDRVPVVEGVGSVLAEKVVDALVLLAFVAAGAGTARLWIWCGVATAGFAVGTSAVLLLMRSRARLAKLPGLRGRAETIERLFVAFDALRRAPARLVTLVALSMVVRVLTLGVTHALFVALGADVSFFDTATLWPAAILAGLAPVTLGGMGTRDAAFLFLLGERGHVTHAAILAATMGYWAVATGSFALIGLPFMWSATWRATPAARSTARVADAPPRAGESPPDERGRAS